MSHVFFEPILEKAKAHTNNLVSTGISAFDQLIEGGIAPQNVLLLTAESGEGKTSLCLNMANAIAKTKRRVVFISNELSAEQLATRLLSCHVAKNNNLIPGIPTCRMMNSQSWSQKETELITEAARLNGDTSYYLDFNPYASRSKSFPDAIELLEWLDLIGQGKFDQYTPNELAPIVFVDGLHLISDPSCPDKNERIQKLLVGLKNFASKYNTSVVATLTADITYDSHSNKYINTTLESLDYAGDIAISLIDKERSRKTVPEYPVSNILRTLDLRVDRSHFSAAEQSVQLVFDSSTGAFWNIEPQSPHTPTNNPSNDAEVEEVQKASDHQPDCQLDCQPASDPTTEELELSDDQVARIDTIHNAAYEFCKIMAEDENLFLSMDTIQQISEFAAELLTNQGSTVRFPAVVIEPDGKQYIEEIYTVGD